jgi:hypothetical protein
VFSSGRFQFRSWMVIYVGLIAAFVLAGRPVGSAPTDIEITKAPAMTVASPLVRRDI